MSLNPTQGSSFFISIILVCLVLGAVELYDLSLPLYVVYFDDGLLPMPWERPRSKLISSEFEDSGRILNSLLIAAQPVEF